MKRFFSGLRRQKTEVEYYGILNGILNGIEWNTFR